jgi:hypothetical protein
MSGVTINKKLNLVVEIGDEGHRFWVHSTPITRQTFEKYYMVMASAFAQIMGTGSWISGPRIAMLAIKDMARRLGVWEGPEGVEQGLVAEIHRLTNFVGHNGQVIPFTMAINDPRFNEDDIAEAEGAVAFFTLASWLQNREQLKGTLAGIAVAWGARTTSFNPSEFGRSLQKSTETDNSGEMGTTSSPMS